MSIQNQKKPISIQAKSNIEGGKRNDIICEYENLIINRFSFSFQKKNKLHYVQHERYFYFIKQKQHIT